MRAMHAVFAIRTTGLLCMVAAAATPGLAAAASTASPPARIVSLVPSLTEAVCLLDACDRLVGVDRHSNWPASVRQLPALGGLDETPLEQVVALRPDLVLLPPSARIEPRLRDLGIATLSLPTQTHADVRSALDALGQRLHRVERARMVWTEATTRIAQAAQRVPASIKGRRVYVEVASEPYAAGPDSFIGRTLTQLGMANIVPPELGTFPRLNPEFVVRAAPDVIIATAAAMTQMPMRPGWSSLKATANRACALSPSSWEVVVRPGPRLGEAAEVLADCLARAAPGLGSAPSQAAHAISATSSPRAVQSSS